MTRQEILDNCPTLNPTELAVVLGRTFTRGPRKGQPNVRAIRDEIRAGLWPLVNRDAPATRWQVPRAAVLAAWDAAQ